MFRPSITRRCGAGHALWILMVAMLGSSSLLAATGYSKTATPAARNLTGVWWIENFAPQLRPADGKDVPLTAHGQEIYAQNQAGLANGRIKDPAISRCLPEVLPRAMNSAYPMQIAQHGDLITLLHEANHQFWHVIMNGKHPEDDDVDPAFMGGSSIGRWEDNTLVIDSIGFKPSFLDATGLPHGEQLHVVTRLRKLSNTQLEAVIAITDPEFFSAPWTVRRTYEWRPDVQLLEFVCGEVNRYLPGNRNKGVTLHWSPK